MALQKAIKASQIAKVNAVTVVPAAIKNFYVLGTRPSNSDSLGARAHLPLEEKENRNVFSNWDSS